MGKYLVAALMVLGMAGMVYASPVGLTSEADATEAQWSYEDITITAGFLADFVDERKIDIEEGKFELEAMLARIGVSLIDRFNFYIDIGQAKNMSYSCDVNVVTSSVKYEFDDEIMVGCGVNALIYRWDNGLEVGVGLNYRQAELELEKVTIDGLTLKKSELASSRDGDYEEWQAALELAWRLNYFIPYVGIKYSDVEVPGDVSMSGVTYNASGKNAGENIGIFAGLTIVPELGDSKQLAINVEARVIDEEALSAGITYKF